MPKGECRIPIDFMNVPTGRRNFIDAGLIVTTGDRNG
jgi:hypothetical protein